MYQKTIIIGHVGKDPESRFTPNGTQVTSFSVATNRQYHTKENGDVKETVWFRVTSWGKQAGVMNTYVKKGMLVFVEGTLTADPKTGGPKVFKKSDESYGATFELNAQNIKFLSSVKSNGQGEQEDSTVAEDDFPF